MDWFAIEILTGLQKLHCLSLDRTPAHDVLPGTAQAWVESLNTGMTWSRDRDTQRIRAAFGKLATIRETWPAPKHFLDALPRVEQAAIAYEVKPASRAEAEAAMAKIRDMLGEAPTFKPEPKPEREGPPLVEVEADLRQHYRGKVAACGPDA